MADPAVIASTDTMTGTGLLGRRTSRPYPVAVVGAFGIDNFGNNATLDATMHALGAHVEVADVLCICSVPEYASRRFGVDADFLAGAPDGRAGWQSSSRIRRLLARIPREIRRVGASYRRGRQVGTLVVAGTGALDDQHIGAGGLPLDIAIWCVTARIARARVVMLSVGAGPITSRISRVLLRAAAFAAHDISFRDTASRDYMRSIGRNVSRDRVAPDLVFGLPQPVAERRAGVSTTVAIGVLWTGNWSHRADGYERYRRQTIALVTRLWEHGHRAFLLVGDRADETCRDELAAALAQIDPTRARDDLECPPVESFDDVVAAMAVCDVAIVARYHHVVAALMAQTPVVSLEYGFKNRALMSPLGLTRWCFDIDEFDADEVADSVLSLAGVEVDPTTRRTIAAWRGDVDRQFAALFPGTRGG